MRIVGWEIDGFGLFNDHQVDELPQGLVVLSGPNEAGKSTLVSFIRGVLFGFGGSTAWGSSHEPVRGGRHGGRLYVADHRGTWVIERHADDDVVRVFDGEGVVDSGELDRIIGDVDGALFANVYAFSLSELEEFGTLDAESVRSRLLAAGVVGGGRSARDTLVELESRRRDLLDLGRGGRIDGLHHRQVELSGMLTDARLAVLSRPSRADGVALLADTVDQTRARVDTERARSDHHRRLLAAWPEFARVQEVKESLDALPSGPVPVDGDSRLERALAARVSARAVEAEHRSRRDAADSELATFAPDPRLDGLEAESSALLEEMITDRQRSVQITDLTRRYTEARAELDEQLILLGPSWTIERLSGFDISIPASELVRAWNPRLEDAERQLDDARRALTADTGQRERSARRLASVRARLEGLEVVPSLVELDQRAEQLRALRVGVSRLEEHRAEADRVGNSFAILRAAVEERSRFGDQPRWLRGLLLGLAGLLIIGAVGAGSMGELVGTAAAGTLAVVLGVAGLRLSADPPTVEGLASSDPVFDLDSRLQLAGAQAEAARQNLDTTQRRLQAQAAHLAFPAIPGPAVVDEELERLRQRRDIAIDRDRVGNEVVSAAAELQALEQSEEEAREAFESSERLAAELGAKWRGWKSDHAVPGSLSPDGVVEFFETVRGARGTRRELERLTGDLSRLTAEAERFASRAGLLIGAAGLDGTDLHAALRLLQARIADDARLRGQLDARRSARAEVEQRMAAATHDVAEAEVALAALYSEAGVADEASLRDRLAIELSRSRLEAERAEAQRALNALIGQGPDGDRFRRELTEGTVALWEQGERAADRQQAEAVAAHEEAVRRHHDAARTHGAELENTTVADLAAELAAVEDELAQAIADWQAITTAHTLLEVALERYEHDRQPAVLARAQEWFSRVTDGRYRTLALRDRGVDITTAAGDRLDAVDLSRGTAEQLYLCIRLALVTELGRDAPLPLIVDDVLVNFDPERATAMAGLIAEVADANQALVITCHPHLRDLFRAQRPSTAVLELPRFAHGDGQLAS
ncbi:MAG: AAA family ATPase [Actinomycetia bacterium]|nr:AAA family ATPase [Actinomycetes bacterium]